MYNLILKWLKVDYLKWNNEYEAVSLNLFNKCSNLAFPIDLLSPLLLIDK